MKNSRRLLSSYLLASVVIVIGAWFKIMHYGFANELLMIGLILQVVFIVVHLVLIIRSDFLKPIEKLIGIIGLFSAPMIAILVFHYVVRSRQNAVSLHKNNNTLGSV